jgi:hypothetical protein
LCLDVPPGALPAIADPDVPLWITEGAHKADAAVSAGLCCLALLGVEGWQSNGVALPDWKDVRLKDREIFLAFDSDVMTKAAVRAALGRLTAWLAHRGATVRHVTLPAGPDGAKVGLDDYLGAGGSVETLAADAVRQAASPVKAAAPAAKESASAVTWDGDGAELLNELHAALTRYVILPSAEAADAVVLWIAATRRAGMALRAAARRHQPGQALRQEPTAGRHRATCHDPLLTVNISPAALVRSIGGDPPTLLLDEADTVFGPKAADNHEDLRGILNAGHSRNRPYIRWDFATRAPEHCPTFAMAALAGIGALPDTITDRAVVVKMRRRAPGEAVDRYRDRRDGAPLKELGTHLGAWVRASIKDLSDAEPVMPVEDRAADTWEPLFAIADLAGGDWPRRAHAAALQLTAEDDTDTSLGARLLADLLEVFGGSDALHGDTILSALHKISEAPWGD